MAAKVVTFAVQLGSDGVAIAQAVADKLHYRYLDNEVVSQAASLAGVSPETVAAAERWPGFVERMLERLALSTVVAEGGLPTPPANPALMMMSSSDYRQLIEQVIRSLAQDGGCVIVGHAGQAILDQTPQVFKVLVHGSQKRRTERLMKDESIEEKVAMQRVKEWDRQRIDFFKHVYNLDWLGSETYDMTINTDDVDHDTAISLIMTGVEAVK